MSALKDVHHPQGETKVQFERLNYVLSINLRADTQGAGAANQYWPGLRRLFPTRPEGKTRGPIICRLTYY